MTTTQPLSSSKNSILQELAKRASFVASTRCNSSIHCRHQGFGHIQKDCPIERAYIATEDGYIITSDVEGNDEDEPIVQEIYKAVGTDDTMTYMSVIV